MGYSALTFAVHLLAAVCQRLDELGRGGSTGVRPTSKLQLACFPAGSEGYVAHTDGSALEELEDSMPPDQRAMISSRGSARRLEDRRVFQQLPADHWDESYDGALRAYGAESRAEDSYVDAAWHLRRRTAGLALPEALPHGGSLILFRSRDVIHEVRPTSHDRYALTMWYAVLTKKASGKKKAKAKKKKVATPVASTEEEALQRIESHNEAKELDLETSFSMLTKGCFEVSDEGFLEAPIYSNHQIEAAWLFLFEIRRRYFNRRKQIQECTRLLGSSQNWSMLLYGSKKIQHALRSMPADARIEILEDAGAMDLMTLLQAPGPLSAPLAAPLSAPAGMSPATPEGRDWPERWPNQPEAWPSGNQSSPFDEPQRFETGPGPSHPPREEEGLGFFPPERLEERRFSKEATPMAAPVAPVAPSAQELMAGAKLAQDSGLSAQDMMTGARYAQQSGIRPQHALEGARMAHQAGVRPQHVLQGAQMAHQAGLRPQHFVDGARADTWLQVDMLLLRP
ncbi:unnamed protein product [Durusdinium trenchii]|uniref:Prolyl 4-hydroxylase alpha subunit Fe(2+) 2OG dioxygenase domain-containing protein n=1 Tax=Durusdinium trenchii TaxID=1381693 RepID=A0ABP0NW36_9DINO